MSWVVLLGLVGMTAGPGFTGAESPPAVAVVERLPAVTSDLVAWPLGESPRPAAEPPAGSVPSPVSPPAAATAAPSAAEVAESPPGPPTPAAPPEEKTPPVETSRWFRPAWMKPWKGSFEVGMDGSAGNSETLNVRLGLDAKRTTETDVLSLDFDYRRSTSEAEETAHRLNLDWRYQLPFPDSPWSCFWKGETLYDEFQPWNVRVSLTTGVGYQLIKTEATTLVGRFGGGFSQDIGGPDPRYVPELNFGVEYERQITKRQKIKTSVEYYPDVTAFGDFRVVSKADWEVLLDEEMNLSLKLSASDNYKRPNPGGKPNDVDYSMVLLWKF